jgi:hypothetical protein
MQFINRYAFPYVVLYGRAYFASAKAAWYMTKECSIDDFIPECLVSPVLTVGAIFVGYYSSGLLAYIYIAFTEPSYNVQG